MTNELSDQCLKGRVEIMKMQLLIGLFIMPFAASAVVIRSDIDDSKYRIDPSEFRALVDMPGEGHGLSLIHI